MVLIFFTIIPQENVDVAHWSDTHYLLSDSFLESRRIVPIDERSFVYQERGELLRIDLPDIWLPVDQVEAATSAAIGVRKDQNGIIRSLTSEEFEKAKARGHGIR